MAALATFAAASFAASDLKPIEQAVAGSWRPAEAKERDTERHPVDSLAFWGLKPGMTILEVQPGGGWWTQILAPYARANKGEFYATGADLADPDLSENAKKGRADYEAKWADKAVYGKVNMINWGAKSAPLPANKFDFVMLTRGMHGWVRDGRAEVNLLNIYNSVKPGGVLAIEQHRAKAGQDPTVFNGYIDRGLRDLDRREGGLQARRQVRDQRQSEGHQGSSLRRVDAAAGAPSSEGGKPVDPSFDRAKYDAIGESDRMTLRFVKPKK